MTDQTTTITPWAPQGNHLEQIYNTAGSLASQGPPQLYPGQLVADRPDATIQGENYLMGYAGSILPGQIDRAQGALGTTLDGSLLRADSNPYLGGYVEAALQPLDRRFQEVTLPQIGSAATQAGAYGGIRQDIVEQQAGRDYLQDVGNLTSGMYNNAYNQGLQTQMQGLALAPQMANLGALPAALSQAVGNSQQSYNQSLIDTAVARWEAENRQPWEHLGDYLNIVGGQSYGSTHAQRATGEGGGLLGALGGAATGAALAAELGVPEWMLALAGGIGGYGG